MIFVTKHFFCTSEFSMNVLVNLKTLKMKQILILHLMCFMTFLSMAQKTNLDVENLDQYFLLLEQHDKFMGSVVLSHEGEVVYSKSIGFNDVEEKVKADKNSKYRIGSISKMFTSVLILKAAEEKKLKLNQKINNYFPDVKNAEKISIKNLLNHRSGIHSVTNDPNYLEWCVESKSKKELLELIENGGSDFEPDEKASYSNSNYILLTFILEEIYKMSFEALLEEKITEPFGLKNTYYGGKINTGGNECYSYRYLGQWKKENETDMSIPQGAGAIVSNPKDLISFIENLFEGKIISLQSLKQMKEMEGGYGLGCFEYIYGDLKSYGHDGAIDGFSSKLSYFPKEKISLVITSNGVNYDVGKIERTVLGLFFNQDIKMPEFSSYEASVENLEKYKGVYACEKIPIQIEITLEKQTLLAKATNQPQIPLVAVSEHIFSFEQAGVVLEFNPDKKEMLLMQRGGEFVFTKE